MRTHLRLRPLVNMYGIVLKMLSVISEINLQSVESGKAALLTVTV